MKTLIALISLLVVINSASAQFNVAALYGFGVEINSNLDYELYQTSITAVPQFQFGKFYAANQTTSLISDVSTRFFSGLKLGYEFYSKTDDLGKKDYSINGTVHGLIGTEGSKLTGAGVQFRSEHVSLDLQISQEYKKKSAVLTLSLGYFLMK